MRVFSSMFFQKISVSWLNVTGLNRHLMFFLCSKMESHWGSGCLFYQSLQISSAPWFYLYDSWRALSALSICLCCGFFCIFTQMCELQHSVQVKFSELFTIFKILILLSLQKGWTTSKWGQSDPIRCPDFSWRMYCLLRSRNLGRSYSGINLLDAQRDWSYLPPLSVLGNAQFLPNSSAYW